MAIRDNVHLPAGFTPAPKDSPYRYLWEALWRDNTVEDPLLKTLELSIPDVENQSRIIDRQFNGCYLDMSDGRFASIFQDKRIVIRQEYTRIVGAIEAKWSSVRKSRAQAAVILSHPGQGAQNHYGLQRVMRLTLLKGSRVSSSISSIPVCGNGRNAYSKQKTQYISLPRTMSS